jgi:hypothetical protein
MLMDARFILGGIRECPKVRISRIPVHIPVQYSIDGKGVKQDLVLLVDVALEFGKFDRIGEPIMNPVPDSRMLFWACYLGGTQGPILGTFLISLGRRPHDDIEFLLSWILWFSGAVLLIACAWSVRAILLSGTAKSRRPLWLYRSVGCLAVLEAFLWGFAVFRAI